MTIREYLLNIINDKKYKPLSKDEFAAIFNFDRKNRKALFNVLDSLEKEGLIVRNNEEKYVLINDRYLVVGHIQGNEKGFAFLIPLDKEKEDVFISKSNLKDALHGDKVVVNILSEQESDRRQEGEVLRVLERKNKTIVGTFTDSKNFGFVIPDESKINYDIFIPKSSINSAKHNQKVVVEITKWPINGKNPEGKIIEILGYMSEKGTDIRSVIKQYDLAEDFPDEVLDYVDEINQEVTEEEIEGRLDLRDENIFTIDGFDAKDLDDAVSIKKLENGNYRLGVHIADVAHYVKEGSVLDQDAMSRGNSVYLLDRVVPMLPEDLSNGICSLNPGEDRLCLSIIMDIDKYGNVKDNIIKETVINSKKRLVYDDVSDYLEFSNEEAEKKLEGVTEELGLMQELAEILRSKREERGSIDFDFIETRIILDEKGKAVNIVEEERRIGNKIIEEFMLISNETISEQFFWAEIPFLYRIHENPAPEKIEEFSKVIHNLGYSLKGKQDIHPKALQQLLEEVKGKKEEPLISTLMLRSLRKAIYSEVPDIHFGLASEYYSHFTAPIRRYPDLVIHRIIKDYINGKLSNKKIKKLEKTLPEIAEHTSKTERVAEEAEREVEDMKKAEYMQEYIGENFKAVVSSLTRFGIFVQLDNTIEGLIRFADMNDDYYDFDEENYLVMGERTGKVYKLGDKVSVKLINASPAKREIDFKFIREE